MASARHEHPARTNCENPRSSAKNGREVGVSLSLTLNDGVLEAIAQRAAELVLERMPAPSPGRFVTVPEAAELLRCKRQRVDDLLSQRRLSRFKEGGRTLLDRAEVEALVQVDRVARPLPTGAAGSMARGVAG